MSDFLYSSEQRPQGQLAEHLRSIYHQETPSSWEFHGHWGSLAVTRGHYFGFDPVIQNDHICTVVGGPALYFTDNDFLTGTDAKAGTRAILERWVRGGLDWTEDLSGPFVFLIINTATGKISCVTDLMLFIPVYGNQNGQSVTFGTHVDAVAAACGRSNILDQTSLVDFVLHSIVTYPYTAYEGIRQFSPAAEHRFHPAGSGVAIKEPDAYWQPTEDARFPNLQSAANCLRDGLQDYVTRVTTAMNRVAHFISAGEDSRAVAGLLPPQIHRDAYIFLDRMNWEGAIAQRVAQAYGTSFNPWFRAATHYLDILPEASALIGLGHQYTHAHSLGFHRDCRLADYSAVFGGYLADSLLKGYFARKLQGSKRFLFLPDLPLAGESRSAPVRSAMFEQTVLDAVTQRRNDHLARVRALRPKTAHEWFALWPVTMRRGIPNLYSNRRLFASYEPFTAKEVVKVAAAVPIGWKLNRRLFNLAMRPMLRPSKWIGHPKGHLPYFSWWQNAPIVLAARSWRRAAQILRLEKGNQGPWRDWKQLARSAEWQRMVVISNTNAAHLGVLRAPITSGKAFNRKYLSIRRQVNVLQISAHPEVSAEKKKATAFPGWNQRK